MMHDVIIVGAGAAGLFAGASVSSKINGLILEKSGSSGKKLLMSGSGQCNATHAGDIKDFASHYGENGSRIRSILYRFNNKSVIDFFAARGVPLFARDDGKIFPVSHQARDVLDSLLSSCAANGFGFLYSRAVTEIVSLRDYAGPLFSVSCGDEIYSARKIIIATGGCSYPATGSDGSVFPVLEKMGIKINPLKPALVPLMVRDYPYKDLAGIALSGSGVTVRSAERETKPVIAKNVDDLLLTHDCFSGPVILNSSRYASAGDLLCIDYIPRRAADEIVRDLKALAPGNKKQFITVVSDIGMPKRFLEKLCSRCGIDPSLNLSQLTLQSMKAFVALLKQDTFSICGTGGFASAMATSGGVSLDEVDIRTLESKKYPGLFFAGEVLDVDGDTGGYNLQFAFSSGNLASTSLS